MSLHVFPLKYQKLLYWGAIILLSYWGAMIFIISFYHDYIPMNWAQGDTFIPSHKQCRMNQKTQSKPIWMFTKRAQLIQYLFCDLPTQTFSFFFLMYLPNTDSSSHFHFKLVFSISFNGDAHKYLLQTQNALDSCPHFSP